MNTELKMMELNDNELDCVIGGIGARPPKRPDTFLVKTLAKLLAWFAEKIA